MKTIILLVNTFCGCFSWLSRLSPACLPCKSACHWATVTAAAAAGRPGPRPHVEHHSHRTVVSRGAVESPSSAPPPTESKTWSRGTGIVLWGTWLHVFAHLLPKFWFLLSLCTAWRHHSGLRAPSEPVFGHTSDYGLCWYPGNRMQLCCHK